MTEYWADGHHAEVAYRIGLIAADRRATGALRRHPRRWSERRAARISAGEH